MACDAARLEEQFVTTKPLRSKLGVMRIRVHKGTLVHAALVTGLLALGGAYQACYASDPPVPPAESAQPERDSKAKDRHRNAPKCPDGGGGPTEKRSRFAPLSPLVA
jgi:hypothetical protein